MQTRLRNEAALQRKVLAMLEERDEWFGENRTPSPFGRAGVPDIIGCYRGRYVAIELKHPRTGKQSDVTPEQTKFLERVAATGGCALATNSYDAVVEFMSRVARIGELHAPFFRVIWDFAI